MITLRSAFIRSLFVPRKKDSHKGDYGHVLIIAGSRGMTGAPALCANAALRAGAGLVTLGIPARQEQSVISRLRPEAMVLPLKENGAGFISPRSLAGILEYIDLRKVTALAAGPGLGSYPEAGALVKSILASVSLPVVLDADGINALAVEGGTKDLTLQTLRESRAGIVVTPHPGELGRLLRMPVAEIQKDRAGIAQRFAGKNRVIFVLKGYRTVVADGKKVFVNPTGNPGMATGGSGDVLAGMIAAFIAQVKEPRPLNAALAGVYLHGLAGDIAAARLTQVSLLAGDITESLPEALGTVEK